MCGAEVPTMAPSRACCKEAIRVYVRSRRFQPACHEKMKMKQFAYMCGAEGHHRRSGDSSRWQKQFAYMCGAEGLCARFGDKKRRSNSRICAEQKSRLFRKNARPHEAIRVYVRSRSIVPNEILSCTKKQFAYMCGAEALSNNIRESRLRKQFAYMCGAEAPKSV